MCVKQCLCNSCYKRDTCSGCKFVDEHKDIDCLAKGISVCVHHKKLGGD